MKIVADIDLYKVEALFSHFGELVLLPGREIKNHHVLDADALIVRSTTLVSEQLLKGASVKFVASATSGTDHVHLNYLRAKGITFVDAKGSNANAVTDYCLAAISEFHGHKGLNDLKPNVGIIGNGMIGNRLAKKIKGLGWNVLINDPLQSESESKIVSETSYYSLDEIAQCNIISVHVPLTCSGLYATGNLLGKKFFRALPQNAIIINTSRGGVIDEDVLIDMTREREDLIMVIDVWNNEPKCNEALIELVAIATPHIAGYSGRAKANGVVQILRAFSEFFDVGIDPSCVFDSKIDAFVELPHAKDCADAMRKGFPITDISSRFKKSVAKGKNFDGNDSFNNLRKSLVTRAEYCEYAMPGFVSEDAVRFLSVAGFRN